MKDHPDVVIMWYHEMCSRFTSYYTQMNSWISHDGAWSFLDVTVSAVCSLTWESSVSDRLHSVICWCVPDVEASGCDRSVHQQVGDTVEFPSCLPPGRVTEARWTFNNSGVEDDRRFVGRIKKNLRNFSLTVTKLTLQDSGTFRFLSEVNNKQRATVTIQLQVHGKRLVLSVTLCPNNCPVYISIDSLLVTDLQTTRSIEGFTATLKQSKVWSHLCFGGSVQLQVQRRAQRPPPAHTRLQV